MSSLRSSPWPVPVIANRLVYQLDTQQLISGECALKLTCITPREDSIAAAIVVCKNVQMQVASQPGLLSTYYADKGLIVSQSRHPWVGAVPVL